jgi:hypothetical protein
LNDDLSWGGDNWWRRRRFWLICTTRVYNVINYNIIFMGIPRHW